MKSGTMTNVLLALIFLALLANLMVPLLRAGEAVAAAGGDAVPPAVAAARVADNLAADKVAAQIAGGLSQIAQANQQIASAITQHARTNERVADAIERLASKVSERQAQQVQEEDQY